MKSNLKLKVFSSLSALALLLTVYSCDVFSSGVNLADVNNAQKINELIMKHITPDMLVREIEFNYSESSSNFSFNKDGITIVFVDPENVSKQNGIDIDIKSGDVTPNRFYENKVVVSAIKYKGYTVENVDVTPMITAINEAIQLMSEKEIKADGLGICSIKFGADPSKTKYGIKIQSKTGTESRGRRTQVNYDEYSFEVDAEGNIEFD